ncbi:hypothetical protein G9A89_019671 [Geosiphon pyriformis]|nr:hypothetical protein G9A89_019671 [Geosiphon pyriformis]
MACKILSKILSDRISLACGTFNVLCEDNFSVLKDTIMQSSIFAVGSMVEDALEKNHELWLVLQNMHKAYDSVGWEHFRRSLIRIKICNRFIRFFGSIHNGRVNRVMTDFGLTDKYCVHDGLDQGEVFSPLLWHIFYDSLLCEIKRQESVWGYRLNSHYVFKTGRVDPRAGLTSFFAAGAFVNDTIWIDSSQAATQHILNIASEFFRFNDISVNNDKTVAIPINCRVLNSHLTISSAPIFIARKGESHHYLGIFLSSGGLSKPSLAKAQADVRDALHYLSLYNLKTFEQIQAKSKSAFIIAFANSTGVLGHLFSHRSHDLQVLSWRPLHSLLFLARVGISPSNNFLAGVIRIFSRCDLSLGGPLACAFCCRCGTPMSLVLGDSCFFKCVSLLRHYGIAFVEQLYDHNGNVFSWRTFKRWKRLDSRGPVSFWFDLSVCFFGGVVSLSSSSSLVDDHAVSDIHLSHDFGVVRNTLPTVGAARLSVYTDGSLSGLGSVNVRAGAAVFIKDINLGLGVGVSGLVFFTLTELQAIALALECVPFFHLVDLFSNSQAALDACRSELSLAHPDFRNHCWIEHRHITTVICQKNLDVNWVKVKGHLGVSSNNHADALAKDAALSAWHLSYLVSKRFLCAGNVAVSGNSRHFVCDVFWSVHRAHWEVGVGSHVVDDRLRANINWSKSFMVWHSNSHLASSFTSMRMASCHTYFMKALHHQLLVAVRKHLYDRRYPSVVCLFCGNVETSDHVFLCSQDVIGCACLLGAHTSAWKALSGLSRSFSCVLQALASCVSEVRIGVALCKGFVFDE